VKARQWRRLQSLHREYASTRVELNEFEMRILVPELRDRASYMKEVFMQMKETCRMPELPLLLEAPLRSAMGSDFRAGNGDGQAAVRQYLANTEKVIDESYLVPLEEALSQSAVTDTQTLTQFLQRMHFLAESILRSKDRLFSFRFQYQLCITQTRTGATTVVPPADHDAILSHFRVALDQLVRCAEGISTSIQLWKQEINAAKKPFLEFLSASANAQTSRRSIWVQLLAILLALSLSTFFLTVRDPFSLQRDNERLRSQLRELQDRLAEQHLMVSPSTGHPLDGGQP
jgi:hypothetical protein